MSLESLIIVHDVILKVDDAARVMQYYMVYAKSI